MPTLRNAVHVRRIALARVERITGRINSLTRQAARSLLATMPENPSPESLQAFRQRAKLAMNRLKQTLSQVLAAELRSLVKLTYKDTRKLLKRRYRKANESVLLQEDPTPVLDFAELVLPAPDVELLRKLIGIAPARISKIADNERLASIITQGIADEWDRRKITAEVQRVFDITGSDARRVVRTEGLRVATESSLAVSEQLGDLVTGYKISAVLDSRTRPEHKARHGTVYHRTPKSGQFGFDDMPRPPIEADGTVAYNCRCFLIPVFG